MVTSLLKTLRKTFNIFSNIQPFFRISFTKRSIFLHFCPRFSNFLHKTFNIFTFLSPFFEFPSQNVQYFNVFVAFFNKILHKTFNIFSFFSLFRFFSFTFHSMFFQNVPTFPSQNLQYLSFLFWRKTFL